MAVECKMGEITKEKGETMDISNGGLAVYINRWFDVGATCVFTLPRIGTASEGVAAHEVVGVVCWMREMPRGSAYRFIAGVQLFCRRDGARADAGLCVLCSEKGV